MSELSFNRYSGLILKNNLDVVRREIVLQGHVSMGMLSKLDKHLKLLEIQEGGITVKINTPGGDVEACLGIIDRITSSSHEITTVGTGIIMSAGVPILAAGDIRKATRFTRFMHHGMSANVPTNRIPNIEGELKYFKELDKVINRFLGEKTLKNYLFWAGLGKSVDAYFDAETAKEFGVIDEII